MGRETKTIKTGGQKLETVISKSLHKQFRKYCKGKNISMSQRLRDLIQKDVK